MFNKNYESRLREWIEFRNELEESEDPLRRVIDLYNTAPHVRISCDPYDRDTWANPWELLKENEYCDFGKILGICYTLQLTDRFSASDFQIHITQDTETSEIYYLLIMDGLVFGYTDEEAISMDRLPKTIKSKVVYDMPPCQ